MTNQLTVRHVEAAILTIAIKTAIGQLFKTSMMWLAFGICISAGLSWLAGNFDRDDTDGIERSGMRIHTDAKTGCLYLSVPGGGVTPRINPNGQPICNNKE